MSDDLRYPVGRFSHDGPISEATLREWVAEIAALPARMHEAAAGLTDDYLDTPYRPGGWTLRQVIHHVPDSHLNAYIRFKWTLTEDTPTIKPYDEGAWANLGDVNALPVQAPLAFLEALHARWVGLMRTLTDEQWDRRYYHPHDEMHVSLRMAAGTYAWHGHHHLAHLTTTIQREGWRR
ncbi:MAG: YfiT family bacillithiol transferase [Bacteroidota bacterium]